MYQKKYTRITGYKSKNNEPQNKFNNTENHEKYIKWFNENYKSFNLAGHWKLKNAIDYAKKKGINLEIKIEHYTIYELEDVVTKKKWELEDIDKQAIEKPISQNDSYYIEEEDNELYIF